MGRNRDNLVAASQAFRHLRSNMEETVKLQETKVQELVQAKLEQAEERRLELIEKQREKLKERERHGEVVRQNKERVSEGDSQ